MTKSPHNIDDRIFYNDTIKTVANNAKWFRPAVVKNVDVVKFGKIVGVAVYRSQFAYIDEKDLFTYQMLNGDYVDQCDVLQNLGAG